MKPPDWTTVKEIFHAALERPEPERDDFIREACGGREEIRREVESLLGSRTVPWLSGAIEPPPGSDPAVSRSTTSPEPMVGTRIGPYEVAKELGQGGMGSVYLARRIDGDFEQSVAIKVVQPGFEAESVLRRFHQERQILANLSHPHIAHLYDGGSTANGLSYFVMEHIDGVAIDRYCDERQLELGERLELFRTVCGAVHFAHRHLVVHCDLKPSNVMVMADGTPKLLDFGIADLLSSGTSPEAGDSDHNPLRALTPNYASPEQLRGEALTTASDVFSLGALLYRLVSGRDAFTGDRIDEMVPPPPSAPTDHKHAAKIRRGLARDLDHITLRAMHIEPDGRYESAAELAEDVRRLLAEQPVEATQGTAWYRAGKFVRRHRTATAAAAMVIVSLLLGIAGTTRQAQEAKRQRIQADAERTAAAEVASFLVDLFESSDPFDHVGAPPTVADLLDRGAAQIDTRLHDQPSSRAKMMHTIGVAYRQLGAYPSAAPLLEGAVDAHRARGEEARGELALSLRELGNLVRAQGDLDDAERLLREALEIQEGNNGLDSMEGAQTLDDLGSVLRRAGNLEAAEATFRDALKLRTELAGPDTLAVAESSNNLALLLKDRGQLDDAESLYRRSVELYRTHLGTRSVEAATAQHNLADVLRLRGDYASAAEEMGEALGTYQELLDENHPHVMAGLNTHAVILKNLERFDEAEDLYSSVIERYRETLSPTHVRVLSAEQNLAALLVARTRYGEALELYRAILERRRASLGDDHPDVASTLHRIAALHLARRTSRDAHAILLDVVERRRNQLGDRHPNVANSLALLGRTHLELGDPLAAERVLRESLDIRREQLAEDHWRIGESESLIAGALIDQGRFTDAEPMALAGLQRLEAARGPDHEKTREARERVDTLGRREGESAPNR